jgi:hypothetical protein
MLNRSWLGGFWGEKRRQRKTGKINRIATLVRDCILPCLTRNGTDTAIAMETDIGICRRDATNRKA